MGVIPPFRALRARKDDRGRNQFEHFCCTIEAMKGTKSILALLLATGSVSAAPGGQKAVVENLRSLLLGYRQNVVEGAEKLNAADYDFKPVPEVKTVREQLGHIADGNYSLCSQLEGKPNPSATSIEKRRLEKSDLIQAVDASFGYCLETLRDWDDARLAETVKRGDTERAKAWTALHLLEHVALHYGNLITYMRMKGVVPPETERRQRNR